MNKYLESLYYKLPNFLQDISITLYNLNYYKRMSGIYTQKRNFYSQTYYQGITELKSIQRHRLKKFLKFVKNNSSFYTKKWKGINIAEINCVQDLRKLPIVTKEEIRENINDIVTLKKNKAFVLNTGGTTGKSMSAYFTWDDARERLAILDSFRERYGWKLGKKTAWFSGKTILSKRDELNKIFWKTDNWFKIRYYSTFHINNNTIPYYLENLNSYQPLFFSGFPSNMYELAKFIINNNYKLEFSPQIIFTTAETILPYQITVIENAFNSKVIDQYSASEGAPFIVQCSKGKYHYLPETGVIEVLDEKGDHALSGEAIITSFTTHGTPLVRYKLGDEIEFANNNDIGKRCECGSYSPLVNKIKGRIMDFIYSKERGKINLGNISNCVKYAKGVVKFQVEQNDLDSINIKIVKDDRIYDNDQENLILKEFINRLGDKISINFTYVDNISSEKSGKFKIVKNNIYNLLNE